jgi:hypothetical protein
MARKGGLKSLKNGGRARYTGDTGGQELFPAESFAANAGGIPMRIAWSIVLAAMSSTPACSEHQAPAFRAEEPKLGQQSANTHQAPCSC